MIKYALMLGPYGLIEKAWNDRVSSYSDVKITTNIQDFKWFDNFEQIRFYKELVDNGFKVVELGLNMSGTPVGAMIEENRTLTGDFLKFYEELHAKEVARHNAE